MQLATNIFVINLVRSQAHIYSVSLLTALYNKSESDCIDVTIEISYQ